MWLLQGGMCGCSGGHAWLLPGGCVVALGDAWLLPGGVHGCCWGGHVWDRTRYGDTLYERAVCILLECILVLK